MGDEGSNIKHGLEILYYQVIMQMKGRKGSEIATQKGGRCAVRDD